ncbi:MAG: lysine exporter LysO family protein [Bacteroidales bacterium]|nr:lysine exporter LysO family protein [Bacteroidales bacterium]
MISLLLVMALGGYAGFLLRKYRMAFLSTVIQGVICLLLFFLGFELGADRALLGKIGELGLKAAGITVGALLGSLLLSAWIYQSFFKRLENNTISKQPPVKDWGFLKDSLAVFACFFAGMACGGFGFFSFATGGGNVVFILLYILLFLVGVNVGKDRGLFAAVRQQGFRFVLLPLGTLVGTLVGSALAGWMLPDMRIWDSLAIGSGMGYYSVSSVLISHSRGAELGSVALMANILRELITLFCAPYMLRIFGRLAPISAGGVTSMDITLPVIIRFSGKEYAALAVFHGAVLDPLVPVLVGFFGAM